MHALTKDFPIRKKEPTASCSNQWGMIGPQKLTNGILVTSKDFSTLLKKQAIKRMDCHQICDIFEISLLCWQAIT